MAFGESRPETLILVAPELVGFYESIKSQQETDDRSLVVLLDRRCGDRRRVRAAVPFERRAGDRRHARNAAWAMMAVLGFAILHRAGDRYVA